jgi:hypothetical protein
MFDALLHVLFVSAIAQIAQPVVLIVTIGM